MRPSVIKPDDLVPVLLCGRCIAGEGGKCHTPGCGLWMNRAPDIPVTPAEGYWAADEVLETLTQHYIKNTVCSDFKLSIKVLERRFSGKGAS